jgi:hypothetical protein
MWSEGVTALLHWKPCCQREILSGKSSGGDGSAHLGKTTSNIQVEAGVVQCSKQLPAKMRVLIWTYPSVRDVRFLLLQCNVHTQNANYE